jgi:phenylalanyl-tRNA synthetase alpha chain
MVLFDIPDIRLFWSQDPRFIEQFQGALAAPTLPKFKPYSKYPPCIKDITFWIPPEYHENNFFELVRETAGEAIEVLGFDTVGDLVENVKIHDKFQHPKTGRHSHCYRINYRSNDRNLTNEEINGILFKVHDVDCTKKFKRKCERML